MGEALNSSKPDVIVHLAAPTGVRDSLGNLKAYVNSNIVGTFHVMDAARWHGLSHLLRASTSSVYRGNSKMPFAETDKADLPLTIYAASKKAAEAMAQSYAHLWQLPTTKFRFLTVYGPGGRPDMVVFKFVEAIVEGGAIDVYNSGDLNRDFTDVDDLVQGIRILIDVSLPSPDGRSAPIAGDCLPSVAPSRVVNIGNSERVRLLDFIDSIERALGIKAVRNYMPVQKGNVSATWADSSLLTRLTGSTARRTDFNDSIDRFVA